ncbi:MAG: hypothetical protein LW878_03665 [Proteobacteria bacterium]|nr:hypothetical protein [Pseudomonadota bacterium]
MNLSLNRQYPLLLAMLMALTSCMPESAPARKLAGANVSTTAGSTGGSTGGTTTGTTAGSTGGAPQSAPPRVEIRNLVEPKITTADYPTYFTGTGLSGAGAYVRKLTLPQNYKGLLYLGGININSLQNKFVKVRFTFGVNREQVEVTATPSRAPGITPNTEIDVLVMDLRSKPFDQVRLVYDLYDYKDYDNSTNQAVINADPVEVNRDQNLYCRALRLQDDPTFNGVGACDGLGANNLPNGEKCLYSYAKIVDRGLMKESFNGQGQLVLEETYPTLTQVDISGAGYYNQTPQNLLKRCLPDKSIATSTFIASALNGAGDETGGATTTGLSGVEINAFYPLVSQNYVLQQSQLTFPFTVLFSQTFRYHGPFKAINAENWEIRNNLIFSKDGLFDSGVNPIQFLNPALTMQQKLDNSLLFRSKLFPRFGLMDLGASVQYLRTDPLNLELKKVATQPQAGETQLMDGCNLRVASVNFQGEHVGSCNATGKIEILASEDGISFDPVASSNEVILQLVRGTQISGEGEEYLLDNFKQCQNSSQCGGNECCFNNRCWSNDLVTQCVEQSQSNGNFPTGAVCQSDFQCQSLCCNQSTGRCGIHDNRGENPVLCSKPFGQFCVAKEWCQKTNIVNCKIVKTGTDPQGNITCAKRCYNSQEFGDCRQGICIPPLPGEDPFFDPNAPDACDDAVDPPNL